MADREGAVGHVEEWILPEVKSITDKIIEEIDENQLLEESIAEMEEYIKRRILDEDNDPTNEPYTKVVLLYEMTGGFAIPPPPLSPHSPQSKSLLRKFDPCEISLNSSRGSPGRSRKKKCSFCERNGEPITIYTSHYLREGGRVTCPQLRGLVCQECGATGDQAHTRTHCPKLSHQLNLPNMLRTTARTSDGKTRRRGK